MKAVYRELGWLICLAPIAAAQALGGAGPVLRDIVVTRAAGSIRVELRMSPTVQPVMTRMQNPDRLLLHFPGTANGTNGSRIDVEANGVRSIQAGSSDGDTTDVLIQLSYARPYAISAEANGIVLTFAPQATSPLHHSEGAVAAAKAGTLRALFLRRKRRPRVVSDNDRVAGTSATPAPPANVPAPQVSPSTTAANTSASMGQATVVQAQGSTSSVAAVEFPAASARTPPMSQQPQTSAANSAPQAVSSVSGPATTAAASEPGPSAATVPALATAATPVTVSASTPAQGAALGATPTTTAATSGAPVSSATPPPEANKPELTVRALDPALRTVFKVKYIAEGVAYLDGGRAAGLREGVKLEVRDADLPAREGASVAPSDPRVIAELEVTATAESSAVADIHTPQRPVKPGDLAYLSSTDADALVQQTALSPTRKYPVVVSFTEADPEDEEVREEVPRPPLPSVNRARGRIGFDYMGTVSHGANTMTSSNLGMMFRGDITRIGGTYWNLNGYWRGRLNSQSAGGTPTLQDLINRTYHLSMTYDNPNSSWVAGFGRLYLPWATSLDTIDGGYFGRRVSGTGTLGMFAGSTPDPTSYDYSPNREIGGSFLNFSGGDFAKLHYSSTLGAGVSMLRWQVDRPFGFLENTVSYSQRASIYDALQVDSPAGNPAVPAPGAGLSRNFLTLRLQPHRRLELDFNHTYFRDMPTYDPALIGTGLLDKYLFQGFSVGVRAEVTRQISLYTQLGRSSRSGDTSSSINQLYGLTYARLPWAGLRADVHYAQFNSSFGGGRYKAFSLSRNLTDALQVQVLTGEQNFAKLMTTGNRSWFVISNMQTNFGPHYFLQGGYTLNRGQMSYDQWMFTLGYRFDSKGHRQ